MNNRLIAAQNRYLSLRRQKFIGMTAKLDAMSPLKVLSRGYAMAQNEQGQVIRSISQVKNGDAVRVLVQDGVFSASVDSVEEDGK